MQIVSFSKLDLTAGYNNTIAVDNQSFPYMDIANPRRFEELLYSIYKLKIDRHELTNYDDLSLMSGVAEQGRDIILFKNGKSCAVIQCKKYAKNLTKEDFGKEITKLVLYSLLDDRIINDRKDFTYYIAIAKDFTADCRILIDDFNNLILQEPNLEKWMTKNLEMPTLQGLILQEYQVEARDILSKIKVKKIVPQDLDLELLNKPELQQLFFSVRSVTDNTNTEKIINLLNGNLQENDISNQLLNGSISLISEKNTFEGIEDSHITRNETAKLVNWVQSETKRDEKGKILNICLLAAPAGYGKTVILKDFFSECKFLNIPILGLKSDKLYSYNITDLQKCIGLSLPIFDFIEKCKTFYPLTVIVIDQLDALSQSMSSDRRFLDVFKGFVDRFENDANIKIIVSVRNQDLNYDPTLRQFLKNNTIQVTMLSDEQVFEQIAKIGIVRDRVSPKLLNLLKIPNNLNIFSRIATSDESLNVTNIEELYSELWSQKVVQIPNRVRTDKNKVKAALYFMAEKMFKSQRITISILQLENFSDEISYLESEQLIKKENKQVQFFHQSFYDFVFSKQFVEKELNLITYIKEAEQSIHIRSAVKMIIAYLRDYDHTTYEKYANQIISDNDIFFHIKHIIFLNMIAQTQPTKNEYKIVKLCLTNSWNYNVLFFEQAIGKNWLQFALNNCLLEMIKGEKSRIALPEIDESIKDLKDIISNLKVYFLQKFIVADDFEAWEYFKEMEDEKIIQSLLWSVIDWSSEKPFYMLAKCPDFFKLDSWSYYHILNNIIAYDIDFVLNILEETLPQHYKKGKRKNDYVEHAIIDSFVKIAPQRFFPLLFRCMKHDLLRVCDISEGLILDWDFKYTDLQDNEQYHGKEFLYQKLATCLKLTASNYQVDFLMFFNEHKTSNHYAVLRLLLFSFNGNEQKYSSEIIEMFLHFKHLGLLNSRDDLEHDLRLLVGNAFIFMNMHQQELIVDVIRNYQDQSEIRIWFDDNKKSRFYFQFGLAKYYWLLRIPFDNIQNDLNLKKSFLELERKFALHKDLPMKRNLIAAAVHSPITENAHQFMRKKHWLQSFQKYSGERKRSFDNFLKGGIYELSSAFRNVVQKDPSTEKLEIITAVIDSPNIPLDYAVSGLYGWSQSDADLNSIIPLFLTVLKKETYNENSYISSIAGKLAGLETTAPELIQYLVDLSFKFENATGSEFEEENDKYNINKLLNKAINTSYGYAAQSLTNVIDPSFNRVVFDTIEYLLKGGPVESKAAIYFKFHFLTRLDGEKAHKLFVKALNEETDLNVIATALYALPYFRTKGLKILDKPLKLLIESEMILSQDSHNLFRILYFSYLHNQEGAEELLKLLLKSNSFSFSKALGDIMKYYYTVDDSKEKNDKLLEFLMPKVNDEDFEELSWNFYNAGHIKLEDISTFLMQYIHSKYFKITDQFVEYLLTQCSKFPLLAVEIFELAMLNHNLEVEDRHSFEIDLKATKFIIAAYENVNGIDNVSKAHRKKLLQSFDKLITDLRFRRNHVKILSDLI